MKHTTIRALPWLLAIATVFLIVPRAARAQGAMGTSQFGQPKTPFSVADFGKLRWLEGSWEATSPGQRTFYERYHFADDSTIDIAYYTDPGFTHETGTGRIYLTVGRVYHTFGPNRWGATHVGGDGVFFIPQVNAHNSFAWEFHSADSWTSTMRSAMGGQPSVVVYQMRRVEPER